MERLNINELATYLGCSKASVKRYKKAGLLPYYKIGRTVFFDKEEVREAIRKEAKI